MPDDQFIVNALVCEKALQEQDGVASAIRMADVFYYTPLPFDIPIEKQAIAITLIAKGAAPLDDSANHTLQIKLMRPEGDAKVLEVPHEGPFTSKIAGAPGGFSIVAQIPVIPSQMGTHYFAILVDGREMAKVPFTLVRREVEAPQ
jgi:hypothetical protein